MFVDKLKEALEGKNCEGHAEDWVETNCITDELCTEFFSLGFDKVDQIDEDTHRWYDVATVVFENNEEIIGVRGVVRTNGEDQAFCDCGIEYSVFPMKKKKVESFKYSRKEV